MRLCSTSSFIYDASAIQHEKTRWRLALHGHELRRTIEVLCRQRTVNAHITTVEFSSCRTSRRASERSCDAAQCIVHRLFTSNRLLYTASQKNDTHVEHYNYDARQPISVIVLAETLLREYAVEWRSVFAPHLTTVSALPGDTRKRENRAFRFARVQPVAAWFLQYCWLATFTYDANLVQ